MRVDNNSHADGWSIGVCEFCGVDVLHGNAFVDTGPTDSTDPSIPKRVKYVPQGVDIHGWSPFVISHPNCWSKADGEDALERLIAEVPDFWRSDD